MNSVVKIVTNLNEILLLCNSCHCDAAFHELVASATCITGDNVSCCCNVSFVVSLAATVVIRVKNLSVIVKIGRIGWMKLQHLYQITVHIFLILSFFPLFFLFFCQIYICFLKQSHSFNMMIRFSVVHALELPSSIFMCAGLKKQWCYSLVSKDTTLD